MNYLIGLPFFGLRKLAIVKYMYLTRFCEGFLAVWLVGVQYFEPNRAENIQPLPNNAAFVTLYILF